MSARVREVAGGEVPNPLNPPNGCTFHPRCPHANSRCKSEAPELLAVEDRGPGRTLITNEVTMELEGAARPALVATSLVMVLSAP